MMANFVFSYICSFLIHLHQLMLVNVKLEIKIYIGELNFMDTKFIG